MHKHSFPTSGCLLDMGTKRSYSGSSRNRRQFRIFRLDRLSPHFLSEQTSSTRHSHTRHWSPSHKTLLCICLGGKIPLLLCGSICRNHPEGIASSWQYSYTVLMCRYQWVCVYLWVYRDSLSRVFSYGLACGCRIFLPCKCLNWVFW